MHGVKMLRSNLLLIGGGILVGLGLGLLLMAAFGVGGDFLTRLRLQQESRPWLAEESNARAGYFELEDLNGETVHLTDLRGKVVVINFWATWCGPCRIEMPVLEEYHHRYEPEMTVLGINVQESREAVEAYVSELGLTFPILLDEEGKVSSLYRVRGYPSTYILDGEGIIRYQHIGQISEAQLQTYLENLGVSE